MNLRSIALSVLLITTTLISGLSIAEDSDVSMKDSETGPTEIVEPMEIVDIDVETVVTEDFTTDEVTATSVVQSLEGTWIMNMDDAQISMVIYQSEDTLFGAANSEVPKPWNAVVFGSASGDEVELEIHSLMNGVLVSTMITGTATEDTLTGIFIQSDSNGKVNKGSIIGFLTSPETSGYEPAEVPVSIAVTTAGSVTTDSESTETATMTSTPSETTEDGRKKPVDVVTLKDTIPYSPFGI